ncbi:MAG: sulfite exporter TauE/SafE family protein [Fibrobacteria bacterium]
MPAWIYPYLGAFLIGLSKAGFATGLGMLTTPLLATAVPARQAIGIILPLLCFADLLTLSAFWKKWRLELIRIPFFGALAGMALGMGFVNIISEHFLRVSIGATALVLTALLLVRNIWYPARVYRPSVWEALLVGVAAGFSSTISHGAGPIMAIYLMAQKAGKTEFVASNAIFFTVLNLAKVPPYLFSGLITGATLLQDLRYLPLIPVGVGVGWLANRALPQKAFEYLVYALLIITGIQLLLT